MKIPPPPARGLVMVRHRLVAETLRRNAAKIRAMHGRPVRASVAATQSRRPLAPSPLGMPPRRASVVPAPGLSA